MHPIITTQQAQIDRRRTPTEKSNPAIVHLHAKGGGVGRPGAPSEGRIPGGGFAGRGRPPE